MKLYHMAVFVFIFINMLALLSFVYGIETSPTAQKWTADTNDLESNRYQMPENAGIIDKSMYFITASIGAIGVFISTMLYAVDIIPSMLEDFGVPSVLVDMIVGLLFIIYGAAAVVLVTGRRIVGG